MDTYFFLLYFISFPSLLITRGIGLSKQKVFHIYLSHSSLLMHSPVTQSAAARRHRAQKCVKHYILLVNLLRAPSRVKPNMRLQCHKSPAPTGGNAAGGGGTHTHPGPGAMPEGAMGTARPPFLPISPAFCMKLSDTARGCAGMETYLPPFKFLAKWIAYFPGSLKGN